jgi:hypothetical protein
MSLECRCKVGAAVQQRFSCSVNLDRCCCSCCCCFCCFHSFYCCSSCCFTCSSTLASCSHQSHEQWRWLAGSALELRVILCQRKPNGQQRSITVIQQESVRRSIRKYNWSTDIAYTTCCCYTQACTMQEAYAASDYKV